MSSERLIDNLMADYIKRGRKVKNRIYIFIPLGVVLALIIGAVYYYQFMITRYDFSGRLSTLDINMEISPIAKRLALPTDENIDVDDISSESIILVSTGGSLLASKAATKRMYPASTTKVMTALVALKYGNLSDEI